MLTINTDLAETDADVQQFNLTRIPQFYPEKRAFFLEGANMFDFGTRLSESFIPLFSRRAGLFEEERVPIQSGVRLPGQAGRWGIDFLDAYADEMEPSGYVPEQVSTRVAMTLVIHRRSP